MLQVVGDRSAATLEPVILQYILQGTHIISDGWRAYRNLANIGQGVYQHYVVVHEQQFVHPMYPEVHTNNIENLWMRAKRKLKRRFGTSREPFPTYLTELQYRTAVDNDVIINHFLTVLAILPMKLDKQACSFVIISVLT